MSEHKEFDDYIKGLFDENPEVPSELNWEAMDFDLPKTEVVEKEPKKEGKYKKYIVLLLLLLFTSFVGFLGINKHKSNTVQKPVLESSELQLSELPSSDLPSKESKSVNDYTGETDKDQSTEPLTDAEVKESQMITANNQSIELGQPTNDSGSTDIQSTELEQSTNNGESTDFQSIEVETPTKEANALIKSSEQKETPIQELIESVPVQNTVYKTDATVKQNDTESQLGSNLEKTEALNTTSVQPNQDTSKEDKENNLLSLLPSIGISELKGKPLSNKEEIFINPSYQGKKEAPLKDRQKSMELFIGYGYNTFNLDVEASNILSGKLNRGLGKSFTSGVRFGINDSWNATVQLQYSEYHSTFEHIRDLETIIDFDKFERVHRQERTFHNNYTNTLGLKLGIERGFNINNRLKLYPGIGIGSTYTLSITGKTTDGIEVNTLTNDSQKKLFFNGEINLRTAYSINTALNLELAYQYKQFLSDGIFINNGVYTKQQNTVSLMLSYKIR